MVVPLSLNHSMSVQRRGVDVITASVAHWNPKHVVGQLL